jgi:hypothetical protein
MDLSAKANATSIIVEVNNWIYSLPKVSLQSSTLSVYCMNDTTHVSVILAQRVIWHTNVPPLNTKWSIDDEDYPKYVKPLEVNVDRINRELKICHFNLSIPLESYLKVVY